jgi:hypothetical protein
METRPPGFAGNSKASPFGKERIALLLMRRCIQGRFFPVIGKDLFYFKS